jgi:hypothetical protein
MSLDVVTKGGRRVLGATKGRVVTTQVVGRVNAVRRVCSAFFDGGGKSRESGGCRQHKNNEERRGGKKLFSHAKGGREHRAVGCVLRLEAAAVRQEGFVDRRLSSQSPEAWQRLGSRSRKDSLPEPRRTQNGCCGAPTLRSPWLHKWKAAGARGSSDGRASLPRPPPR